MDIQLEKKKGIQKKHLPYIAGGSVIILLLAWVIFGNHAATMRVDSKSINIRKTKIFKRSTFYTIL